MTMSDPIADMLTRIRNGQQARLSHIVAPASKKLQNVLKVLKDEGYIRDYEVGGEDAKKPVLMVHLKYHEGEPVIRMIKRVSTPGRRTYASVDTLPRVHNGLGISVISTSKGMLSDYEARAQKVGGEVICSVF